MEEEGGFAKLWFFIFAVLFAVTSCTTAVDTIFANQTLRDGETLVSPNGYFELGFYGVKDSTNRSVGIMFKKDSCRLIRFIINMDTLLTNTSGELSLTLQGSLVVRYSNGHVIWSSGKLSERKLVGQLLDNGDFVIWEENVYEQLYPLCIRSDYPGDRFEDVPVFEALAIFSFIRDLF